MPMFPREGRSGGRCLAVINTSISDTIAVSVFPGLESSVPKGKCYLIHATLNVVNDISKYY